MAENPWYLMMRVWGWGITDHPAVDSWSALRNPAWITENRDQEPTFHCWDRKPQGLRFRGERQLPVPDWWALHYLPHSWMSAALKSEAIATSGEGCTTPR